MREMVARFLHPDMRAFAKGVGWTMLATVIERGVSLIQTFVIARLLGMDDYGRYGLLFVTVGLLSSIAGLQLGLTVTVSVARHRHSDPGQAIAIVRLCEAMSLAMALIAWTILSLRPDLLGSAVVGVDNSSGLLMFAGFLAVIGVLGGIEDGVLQGLEDFKALATIKSTTAILSIVLIFAMARKGDLDSVVLALALGGVARFAAMFALKEFRLSRIGATTNPAKIWAARDVLWTFSMPSVIINALIGFVNWYGISLVGAAALGDVAVLTAGQQWRGTALLVSGMLSSVVVPMLTRSTANRDLSSVSALHRANIAINISIVSIISIVVSLLSSQILSVYGSGFTVGYLAFFILILSSIPSAYINSLHLYLISSASMWSILYLNIIQSLIFGAFYFALLPAHGALGYAVSMLAGTCIYAICLRFQPWVSVVPNQARPVTGPTSATQLWRKVKSHLGASVRMGLFEQLSRADKGKWRVSMNVVLRKIRSAGIRFKGFVISQRFGFTPDKLYGDAFYDGSGFAKTENAAEKIGKFLVEKYNPKSVLDIGCGQGNYLKYFAQSGCLAVGCDGSSAGISRVPADAIGFQFNVCEPLFMNRKFSLVFCVEVGEHIPGRSSETLVDSICRNAEAVIVFSAAPPGVFADDHINLRPHSFWDGLFARNGFKEDSRATEELRELARREELPEWWRDWSYIYVVSGSSREQLSAGATRPGDQAL